MINKKLLKLMEKEKVYILYLIMLKIVALLLNVGMIYCIANSVTSVINLNIIEYKLIAVLGVILLLQIGVIRLISAISNELSCKVKEKIRIKLFDKVYSYGMRYSKNFNIAEISQLSVNGIENLEVYFSSFIPQLVYSIVSPIILFCFY
ncbi:ABC superfamily ATP binding cassette transporter, ABC/membrane protein [Peptoniphilus indolicus ATCC 29427]|uniref:ABC superfamily ATP binding cassette transporter, ABC/membrane protein n=1 Tax=Peptoniphilus indolicus ATCC 29427 TaxID=997350 RepID=G4D518_9FIRM|nr:ABC transporter transmembrane domain-containing protein [Peptoniphilus indolicus]EGY79381.1 ABC superfamily ATP binding cassette transporter, ABC/membrane protein [Peptoniphilus indolicus ATCC 29427]